MEAARTSETSLNFYQTTRRNNPQDSHLLLLFYFSSCNFRKGKNLPEIVAFCPVISCKIKAYGIMFNDQDGQ
jgi:hypothetical protein